MSNIQYAVCHLQRGSGSDSGMSCHIERKDTKGKTYVPDNANAKRTHLNRELIKFPQGVANRTEAIQYRIDHVGLHRKVGKNQTKAIRIILTGTHEQMMKLQRDGKLDQWIKANLSWLKDTFGEENLVSCVLHMDEKTPHLHATIIPIVTIERKRKEREGEKKYATKSGPRLSADDVMARGKLFHYRNTYAVAMKPFGLQRGVVGSTARHKSNSQYYRELMLQYEQDIEKLQTEVEKAREGRSKILSFFGTGELAEAKKKLSDKDKQIEKLQQCIAQLEQEQQQLKEQHKAELAKYRNGYMAEIDKAIKRAEIAERKNIAYEAIIEKQKQRIDTLDRKANPHRYRLSSGATLMNLKMSPHYSNVPSLHIWTKVGNESFDDVKYFEWHNPVIQKYLSGELTEYELINEIFEPFEQVSQVQAQLLGATLEMLSGGPAQTHVGTGGGGSSSDMPWGEKKNDCNTSKRRR